MGSPYGFGGIGKTIGPLGLALIVGSSNYLKPDVPLPQIPLAFLYLGCWFLMAGTVYYFFGIKTRSLMGTRKPREGIVAHGTEKKYEDTGRLDHIGFAATDVEGMRQRLQSRGVKFRESIVPRTGDTQFFLYDPDGVGVELNFPKS
jgi:catechol 2,3-dioxygenase-like lactoylglutathione lyase family enzyme